MTKRYCILSSTGGSVAKAVWKADSGFRSRLQLILTDRECGSAQWARAVGIPHEQVEAATRETLSELVLQSLISARIDYVFLFFSRLLSGDLLARYSHRIINFHPSLLPSCPGLAGYQDSLRSGALVIGCTAHFVDAGMDTGQKIVQGVIPVDPRERGLPSLRHKVFLAQCSQLLQIFRWLEDDRIVQVPEAVSVRDGDYSGTSLHVPAIDSDISRRFSNELGP